ncbi:hypothetical protein BGY98DRAFT_1177012 [Russula aff. rugulosa BPL654]|nr:hypothetical protein BGY98DRAFT_1177012 [Russula aff. rugulosa BPL654]
MRRYMAIAFLFLSIVNFAFTAPVIVRGVHEVHANVDGAATWRKRYSPLSLTYSSLSPISDYSPSPSSLLRPRENSPQGSSSTVNPPPTEEVPSSQLGADSTQSSSSVDDAVDSPRTKNFLISSSRLGAGPSNLASAEVFPEPDPDTTDPKTKDYLSLLGAEPSNLAGPSRDPRPAESETKELLGQFLKGKFKRRISG